MTTSFGQPRAVFVCIIQTVGPVFDTSLVNASLDPVCKAL